MRHSTSYADPVEIDELRVLQSPEGLALLRELAPLASSSDAAREVSRLRNAGHDATVVAAAVGQALLRHRAAAKFGERAERMLFTRAGLEQATRQSVAGHHAQRMADAGITHVTDLGCGIGGDALGFAEAGLRVTAVDADEVTATIAAHNLAGFGDQVEVRHATAEDAASAIFGDVRELRSDSPKASEDATHLRGSSTAVWLDPARRTGGHTETRRVAASDYSPPLDWTFALAARLPAGIKLSPAHDRDELPEDAETQWISADGSVVELVVWTGALARAGIRRSALVLRGEEAHELVAASDAEDAPVREIGAYLHEPDGAVIRARLIGDLARSLEAGMLDPHIAYLTSDAAHTSPFTQAFRVREVMPAKVPTINAALRANDIGTLEIKKRGMDIDPAQFRRKLVLRGRESATLLLTRVGQKRLAILADRV